MIRLESSGNDCTMGAGFRENSFYSTYTQRPFILPIVSDSALINAYASGGYSMKEIGDYFKLHYSRFRRIVKTKDNT